MCTTLDWLDAIRQRHAERDKRLAQQLNERVRAEKMRRLAKEFSLDQAQQGAV